MNSNTTKDFRGRVALTTLPPVPQAGRGGDLLRIPRGPPG